MFQLLQHVLDKRSVEVNDNKSCDEADNEERNKPTEKALKKEEYTLIIIMLVVAMVTMMTMITTIIKFAITMITTITTIMINRR